MESLRVTWGVGDGGGVFFTHKSRRGVDYQ